MLKREHSGRFAVIKHSCLLSVRAKPPLATVWRPAPARAPLSPQGAPGLEPVLPCPWGRSSHHPPRCRQHFAPSEIHFPRGVPRVTAGPSWALWWGSWNQPALTVTGLGQPWPLLTTPCRPLGTDTNITG